MNPPANYAYLTASGAVKAGPGELLGLVLAAASVAATLTLYDNPSAASGDIIAVLKSATNNCWPWSTPFPIRFKNGLYASITGTGATVAIFYY